MFDLDRELERFLRALGDRRLVSRGALDEIESHIRDEIDDLIASGYEAREAFERAIASFGRTEDLMSEYEKLFRGSRTGQAANVLSHYFDRRTVMKILIGLGLGAMLMLAGLVMEGGHVSSVLQLTAFVLVSGTAVGMTLLRVSWREMVDSYADAFKGKLVGPDVFRAVGKSFLNSGLVGAFVGFIQVVRHLRTPDLIGAPLALAIVSMMYGFLGYLIFGLAFEARAAVAGESEAPRVGLVRVGLPFVLIAAAIAASLRIGLGADRLRQFLNLPAALVVGAGVLIVAAFTPRLSRAHLPFLANGALATGIVGCVFNFIHVMENLDKPDTIFIGLSVSLLPLLYAGLVSLALRAVAESKGNADVAVTRARPQTLAPYYVASVSVLLVSTGLVMYAIGLAPA